MFRVFYLFICLFFNYFFLSFIIYIYRKSGIEFRAKQNCIKVYLLRLVTSFFFFCISLTVLRETNLEYRSSVRV